MSLKSKSGRLSRWALLLQEFNLKIEYMPGRVNVLDNMLSRPSCTHAAQESCDVCSIIIDVAIRKPSDLRAEQLKDEEFRKNHSEF